MKYITDKRLTPISEQVLFSQAFVKLFCEFWEIHKQTFVNYKRQYKEGKGKGCEMFTHDATLKMLYNYRKQDLKDFTLKSIEDLYEKN